MFSSQNRPPNQAVQLTPLARLLGWARFTRQSATAYWHPDNAQLPDTSGEATFLLLQWSAARTLPGNCLCPTSSTLQTPASGAVDSYTLGGFPTPSGKAANGGRRTESDARGVPAGMTARWGAARRGPLG